MRIQTGMQQSQASMTPLTDRLEIRNRVRDDVQQTSRTEKQKENPVAEAGRSYLKENPAPDPKEGVVMSISEMGKRAQANPQDKVMAQDEDGSVVRRQEATARTQEAKEAKEAKEEKEEALNSAQTPKNPREAVEAVAEKREEEATKIQSPAQEKEEAIMKAEPPKPQTPQEKAKEDDGSVQKAEPPVPGKDELEDISLEGTVSLKEYQQQRMQNQAAEAHGADMLRVA